jgi:hemerythrin-like metal-binding protein
MSVIPVKILEWSPEFAVHVPKIDREHETWFGIVNRLHEAMLSGAGAMLLETGFAQTMQFAFDHFAHEEDLMARVRYPDLQAHVRQHDELRRKAGLFAERFKRGETTMTIEMMLFLAASLKQQIMTADLALAGYLRQRRGRGAFVRPH